MTMRYLLVALILIGAVTFTRAGAQEQSHPCDVPESKQFDFWLGEWDLSWPAEQLGGEAGVSAHGSNRVVKVLDDCVIYESFRYPENDFNGHSFSVYDRRAGLWRQTWVDNRGGYLVFTGSFADGKMDLRTEPFERNGTTYISRMVFRNITENSLDWDWQRSSDDGQTWQDVWNIHYERKQ